jgi:hypothetical protein
LSAEEKRGWKDTPYLQSVFDFAPCTTFEGHGVGLAGKGAQFFAEKGMKAEDILQWYYPGVEVVEIYHLILIQSFHMTISCVKRKNIIKLQTSPFLNYTLAQRLSFVYFYLAPKFSNQGFHKKQCQFPDFS